MLAAKWKGSGSAAGVPNEAVRAGQIRKFRILSMDATDRRIEVELAD
jgi:ribosomal protein S1